MKLSESNFEKRQLQQQQQQKQQTTQNKPIGTWMLYKMTPSQCCVVQRKIEDEINPSHPSLRFLCSCEILFFAIGDGFLSPLPQFPIVVVHARRCRI